MGEKGLGREGYTRECGARVSSQSLLACYVSPHSSCLISRDASGQAQGLSEDFHTALSTCYGNDRYNRYSLCTAMCCSFTTKCARFIV